MNFVDHLDEELGKLAPVVQETLGEVGLGATRARLLGPLRRGVGETTMLG